MVHGVITAKHILAHPITLVTAIGLAGYLNVLLKCLDRKPHCFLELMYAVRDEGKRRQERKQGRGVCTHIVDKY